MRVRERVGVRMREGKGYGTMRRGCEGKRGEKGGIRQPACHCAVSSPSPLKER